MTQMLTEPRPLARRAGPPPAPRLGGLDGLRAIAVSAVVLFHVDPQLVPGGFLGVDTFFVISGFVITRLLLGELVSTGGLRLGRFYANRVRRLFPSVAVLIVVVSIASLVFWRDELATLEGSVLSSLGYATNWWLIFDHQSYFVASGRPPMLQHLWSLAIEEQYYLVWPLVLLVITGAARGGTTPERRCAAVGRVALMLAVASTAAMSIIAIRSDVPYAADSARVYFGTDTHSIGLFLGSAAGAWNVASARQLRRSRIRFVWLTDLLALGGLALLGWEFLHLDEFRPALYRGGFLLLDLIALVVVCASIRPGSAVRWMLDRGPLRWLGQRSYAIYLWHWPVVVVTRPGVDVHGWLPLIDVGRVALIVLLAEGSYRLVETPLRSRRWAWPRVTWSWVLIRVPVVGAVAAVAAILMVVRPQTTTAGAPAPPSGSLAAARAPTSVSPSTTAGRSRAATASAPSSSAPVAPAPVVAPPRAVGALNAFGDSVLLGAEPDLVRLDPAVDVDAVEGRQANLVLDDVVADHQRGRLAGVVVIHAGNNGIINPAQLNSVLTLLADRARVVLLTDRVPRDWQAPNNVTITAAAARFGNVRLVDWYSISAAHPEWFYADGLHLKPPGAAAYAQLIMTAAGS